MVSNIPNHLVNLCMIRVVALESGKNVQPFHLFVEGILWFWTWLLQMALRSVQGSCSRNSDFVLSAET